nr:hypothetical protein [uncultured Brevundimonas sp.]
MLLSLLMRVVVDSAAVAHAGPVMETAIAQPAPVVDRTVTACDPMLLEAAEHRPGVAAARPGLLLDRARDAGEARRYLLFDLRDGAGCPTPISYDLPGQGAAPGRNLLPSEQASPAPRPFAPRPR